MKKIVEVEVGEYCEECNIRAYINKWHSCPIAPSYKRMDYENVVNSLKTLKVELDEVFKKNKSNNFICIFKFKFIKIFKK